MSKKYKIYNKDCFGLSDINKNTIDALATDPPYGICFQNNHWDKCLPKKDIWEDCISVLKPGAFGVVFSSIRLMHRLMVDLEDSGFLIKDVLFWSFLNGMPKSRDISIDIDKELGIESTPAGVYNYVQGYKKGGAKNYYADKQKTKFAPASEIGIKYKGAGLGLKPAYEPIILVQKPIETGLTVAQNIIKHGVGVLNIEDTRIPYAKGESKVGHNPHPNGRVPANLIRTDYLYDDYDKFFMIPKVRQSADEFNDHPTIKPVELMQHLVKLISFDTSIILDPFMGSGSTGVACLELKRSFIGYEAEEHYYNISERRLRSVDLVVTNTLF